MNLLNASEKKPSVSLSQSHWFHWLLLVLLSFIWGSSYILIKKGLVAYSAEQLASLRVCISSLTFLPIFISRYAQIDWSKLRYLVVVGFSGSFIPAFLFAFAQTKISSSMAGALSSLTPLFTLVLGVLFFKIPLLWRKVFGVLLGLSGALFLLLFGTDSGLSSNLSYGLLVVMGCFFYAVSVNTVKASLQEMNSVTLSAVAFSLIGIPGLAFLLSTDFLQILQEHEQAWSSLGYIALLAIFGTVLASVLFFRLVQLTNPIFASMVSYMIPIVALSWGFFDGETITLYHFIGMTFILLGVYIARR
ncbi:MAG: DMT family transporter [Bacteroidota bacterium]